MPRLWVFAGPNGSGKSTVTSKTIHIAPGVYINADMIGSNLGCSPRDAARIAEETREYYLARNEDFTFETVLSTNRNLDLMRRAKKQGYEITCFYILTNNPEINIARVKKRVRQGGHDVPKEKVQNRYFRCIHLLPSLIPICDHLLIFDNTGEKKSGEASVIVHAENGKIIEIFPNLIWSETNIKKLLEGTYGVE